MQRLSVRVLVQGTTRPRRRDVEVKRPDGSVFAGVLVSPSAIDTFMLCQRKWGFDKLDRVPRVQKPSAALGEETHAQLRRWLTTGAPPRSAILTNSGALGVFPLPGTPGMETEEPFAIEVAPGLVVWGFKDVEVVRTVFDLKTCGSFDRAKTEEDLVVDPQANFYGLDNVMRTGQSSADLVWVYVRTKGAPACQPTRATITRADLERQIQAFLPTIRQVTTLQTEKRLTAIQLPATDTACGAFGGCEYRERCIDLKPGSGFLSLFIQRHPAKTQEKTTMPSVFDKVKAKAAQIGAATPQKLELAEAEAPMVNVMTGVKAPPPAHRLVAAKANADAEVKAALPAAPEVDWTGAERMGVVLPGALGLSDVYVVQRKDGFWMGKDPTGEHVRSATSKTGAVETIKLLIIDSLSKQPPAEPIPVAAEATPAPAPTRRGPGRPKKVDGVPVAVVPTPTEAQGVQVGAALYVDCLLLKGDSSQSAEVLWAAARALVEAELGCDYRLAEYGKGGAIIAAQLCADAKDAPLVAGRYHVSRRETPKEIVDELIRLAKTVVIGI